MEENDGVSGGEKRERRSWRENFYGRRDHWRPQLGDERSRSDYYPRPANSFTPLSEDDGE